MNTQNFIKKIKESRKNNKVLRNILTVLGCLVFFVTTYVFLLPALAYSDPIDYALTFNREKTIEKYTETIIENEETKEVEKQREVDNNVYAKINYVYFEKNNRDDTLYYLNHNSLIVDKNMKLEELFANSTTIEQDETIYELEEIQIKQNDIWNNLDKEANIELIDNAWYIGEYQIDNNTNLRVVYTYEYEENTIIEEAKELVEDVVEAPKMIMKSIRLGATNNNEPTTPPTTKKLSQTGINNIDQKPFDNGVILDPYQGNLGNGDGSQTTVYTGSFVNEGDVQVKKTVSQTSTEGVYNVEFSVRGKPVKSETNTRSFTVLVLDASTSMSCTAGSGSVGNNKNSWNYKNTNGDSAGCKPNDYTPWKYAKDAAKSFSQRIVDNNTNNSTNHKVALVEFYGRVGNTVNFQSSSFDITNHSTSNGTNYYAGLNKARELLNGKGCNNNDVVCNIVFISDGQPNTGSENKAAYNYENNPKEKQRILSVMENELSVMSSDLISKNVNMYVYAFNLDHEKDADAYKYLDRVATGTTNPSAYSTEVKDLTNDGETGIQTVLNELANKITSAKSTITKGTNTNEGVTDIIGNQFVNGGTNLVFSEDITIDEEWKSLGVKQITIKPDTETGIYPSNNGFSLKYKDTSGQIRTITSNDDPLIYWVVTNTKVEYYYDGVIDNSLTETNSKDFIWRKDTEFSITENSINKNLKDGYFYDHTNPESMTLTVDKDKNQNIIRVYYVSGKPLPETGSRGELICLYMGLTIMLGTLIYGYIYYKKETN